MDCTIVPDSLKSLRESRGWTAQELAVKLQAKLGGDLRTVESIYMLEKRGTPNYTTIRALADIFHLTTDEMASLVSPSEK